MSLPVSIRLAMPSDMAFVYKAWLQGYRRSRFASEMTDKIYYRYQHRAIERILEQQDTEVRIATPSDDKDTNLGFLVLSIDPVILHYAYTKEAFRRMGILRALLKDIDSTKPISYTHRTDICASLIHKWQGVLEYNRYLI